IIDTDLEVGNFVFVFDDRPAPGIPYKLRIPYKGPYRVLKLYDNTAVLAIGDDEKNVNVSKIIKLRNFTLPQRDLKGRTTNLTELLPTGPLAETFERAKELTDKLLFFKRDGKIWKQAKKNVKESFFQGSFSAKKLEAKSEEKTDIDEIVEDKVAEAARDIRDQQRTFKQIASTRIPTKLHITTTTFTPGKFTVAWVISSNRLVKILSQRNVPGDSLPWIKVHAFGSFNPIGGPDRVYQPYWAMKGRDKLQNTKPKGAKVWFAELYP